MSLAPPMPYFGGKQRIADKVVELFPPHQHYVEPFAGGLSVLLAKPPSALETVNDLDGDVMTFWRVLRDQPDDLARVCGLTPHGRAEHQASYDRPDDISDPPRNPALRRPSSAPAGSGCPPYLRETRSGMGYRHEMPDEAEHRELAAALNDTDATVVLSGYRSPLYDGLYSGWHVHEIAATTGQGSVWKERTEVLWVNRELHDVLPFGSAS